jgi:hypothetical protein
VDKDLETFWLNRAMAVRPDLLSGLVTPGESPDFVVTSGDRRMGVEVTRFTAAPRPGPNPDQQEGLQHRVLNDARRLFDGMSRTPLRVQAIFSRVPFATKQAVRACSRELASYLAERAAPLPVWSGLEWHGDDVDLPPQLGGVHATVVPEARFAHWTPANAGWVRQATETELATIVGAKDAKIDRYRDIAGELALLIVFDGRPKLGRSIYPPDEPVLFTISTRFDRVLCLDVLGGRVVCLPIISNLSDREHE